MAASYESIIADLRKKNYKPVYFLAGEEPYYIDLISRHIEDNVLEASEKDFNQLVVYGDDTNTGSIIELARKFPMMGSRQVIIVREAQTIKKIEDLIKYIEAPLLSTILVINYKYKKLDKRTRLYKALDASGSYFESPRLYDSRIPGWISHYLLEKGVKIEPEAASLLTEYLGTDLSKIANELEKLIISLPATRPLVTIDIIESSIGISKEYNVFELQKSLATRNIERSNRIARYFADNPRGNPMVLTISSIFSFFHRLLIYHSLKDKSVSNVMSALKLSSQYFIRDYEVAARNYNLSKTVSTISLLREYDMKSKGVGDNNTPEGELLKELVFHILH